MPILDSITLSPVSIVLVSFSLSQTKIITTHVGIGQVRSTVSPSSFTHALVDLVLCRNVFIYLDRDRQAKVLDNFVRSMGRNSYLVLGRSEKLTEQAAKTLVAVDARERIYQKPVHPFGELPEAGSRKRDEGRTHGRQ